MKFVGHSTVSRWADRFRGGCVTIDNDPRPGRLRTSTDEMSMKLVADALEEDRRATCEELCRATGAKTSQENAQEPTSVARGWTTHSPRQCSPTANVVTKIVVTMGGKCYLMRPTVQI